MILNVLVDSGIAGELLESVIELGADATQGQHGPDGTWVPGSAAAGGPGESDSSDRSGGGGDDRQPSDSKRRRDMERAAAETALMDAAANYGWAGTATTFINTAVGGGVALATGINEIHRNQGRRMGGSTKAGAQAMEAALRETSSPRPPKKR